MYPPEELLTIFFMRKLGKKTIVIIAVIVLAVVGFIIYKARGSKVTYETVKVDHGPVVEMVSVTGSIASKTKISLQSEASAKVTDIKVTEGDEVKEGDLLVKLDSRDLSSRIAGQEAAVAAANALLQQYKAGATAAELQVSATAVDSAKARYESAVTAQADSQKSLDNAKASRDNTKAQVEVNLETKSDSLTQAFNAALTASQDAVNRLTDQMFSGTDQVSFVVSDYQAEALAVSTRRDARTALADLQVNVTAADAAATAQAAADHHAAVSSDLQAIKTHLDACAGVLNYADSLSAATRSSYQTSVSLAQPSLTASIQSVSVAKNSFDLQQNLNSAALLAADSAVSNAQAAYNNAVHAVDNAQKSQAQAQADYDYRKAGVRPEQIAAQEAQVRAQNAALSSLYTDLAKRSIKSPIDGVVTDIQVEKGESASMGQVLVVMNTKGKFEIVANISEVDIAKIKVGNPVGITLDAFSGGEKWTGKIVSIRPAETVVQGVIFYETKIVFDNEDERLKSGMTANLEIEIGRKDDALRAPIRGIKEEPGRKYVQVLQNGKPVDTTITVGLENTDWVEVLSGLTEGQEVVVGSTTGK